MFLQMFSGIFVGRGRVLSVYGVWCLVFGLWFIVCGLWYVDFVLWLVWFLVSVLWYVMEYCVWLELSIHYNESSTGSIV